MGGGREGGARGCPLVGMTEGRAVRDGDDRGTGRGGGEGTHVHGAGVVVGGDDADAFAAAVFRREFAQGDAIRRGLGSAVHGLLGLVRQLARPRVGSRDGRERARSRRPSARGILGGEAREARSRASQRHRDGYARAL